MLTLMGTRSPSDRTMNTDRFTTGRPECMVDFSAHSASQIEARKTSQHGRPSASPCGTPVICSAARLNEVIRNPSSTVKTPSATESRMVATSSGVGRARAWEGAGIAILWVG